MITDRDPRELLVFLSVLAVAFVACCGESTEDAVTPDATAANSGAGATSVATAVASVGTQVGTAGLVPRHFPDAADDDWIAMYEASADVGTLLVVYGQWFEHKAEPGQIPEVFRAG